MSRETQKQILKACIAIMLIRHLAGPQIAAVVLLATIAINLVKRIKNKR